MGWFAQKCNQRNHTHAPSTGHQKHITTLHRDAHSALCASHTTVSHVRTRLQGDSTVNAAINCTLGREGFWTKKQSTTVQREVALAVQGKTLELAAAESTDFTWKSFLYEIRKGTLKFLANTHIDTLPTAANLKRWKKSSSDKCKLCKGRQTTAHCLNICKVAMETGREVLFLRRSL